MKKLLLCSILLWCISSIFFQTSLSAQTADWGKSYFNVTKGINGGTVEPGDTLEVRASFVVRGAGFYDSCAFFDIVPAGTAFIPGTIRVLTNEGKIYKQFTDAQFGAAPFDQGWISGTNIRINLGYNPTDAPATVYRRGRIRNTHKPSFFGGTCIMVGSYRVTVTAGYNTTINMGGGSVSYKLGANPLVLTSFPSNLVMVYANYGICQNTIGGNALGTEFNGTFGSGKPRNRGTSANVPPSYTFANFTTNSPNDYFYGIANNTSTRTNYTTSNAWPKPDPSVPTHRVFNVWDIIGDHTGAVSPTLGNPAADTVANSNAGYMLVINASYRIDSAFQQTITNLCPNTYYEISCWMRNICSKCGCDSNGVGSSGGGYIPTAAGDSSGVKPSIIFEINGVDYFSTGQLPYNGQWIRKAFTYLTGPAQTSINLKFSNNAPGGGGNDWALDDIAVATCSPQMKYSPSTNPIVCDSNTLTIYDTVRSYFNNYTYYKWQRSTDGGSIWNDVTGPLGPSVPYWNGSNWEYVTNYTIPASATNPSDSGDLYRLVAATTLSNLSNPSCSFTDATNIITLSVITCGIPLNVRLVSFNGILNYEKKAVLTWTTTSEDEPLTFDIERSPDGSSFAIIGSLSNDDNYSGNNSYQFTDPLQVMGKTYYRIRIRSSSGHIIYSRTIQLTLNPASFELVSFINPFNHELNLDISSPASTLAEITLLDQQGRPVRKSNYNLSNGINSVLMENLGSLPRGIYYLHIKAGTDILHRKLLKQ